MRIFFLAISLLIFSINSFAQHSTVIANQGHYYNKLVSKNLKFNEAISADPGDSRSMMHRAKWINTSNGQLESSYKDASPSVHESNYKTQPSFYLSKNGENKSISSKLKSKTPKHDSVTFKQSK